MAKYDVTLGGRFAAQLDDLIRQFDFLPLPGVRELPVLEGLTPSTVFDQLPENVIQNATELLVDSRRVFRHGNSIVMEVDGLEGRGKTLETLRRGANDRTRSGLVLGQRVCLSNRRMPLSAALGIRKRVIGELNDPIAIATNPPLRPPQYFQ